MGTGRIERDFETNRNGAEQETLWGNENRQAADGMDLEEVKKRWASVKPEHGTGSEEFMVKRWGALNGNEAFDCCSEYRTCTKTGVCLWGTPPCTYRERIESGERFYGTDAKDFSAARYREICRRVKELPEPAREALDALLVVFQEYYRGTTSYVVRNQWIKELEGVGLFTFRPLGKMFPPAKGEKWDARKIRGMVLEDAEYAPLFQKAQQKRAKELMPFREAVKSAKDEAEKKKRQAELDKKLKEKPSEDSKAFLRVWLDYAGSPLRDKLADAYRIASYADRDADLYGEELYCERLLASYDRRIYRLSPFAEDGILTPATRREEELRRVRFSRGYSEEEKARLIAAASFAPETGGDELPVMKHDDSTA